MEEEIMKFIEPIENREKRAPQSRLKITFPNGNTICYRHAVDTIVETLRIIGSQYFEAFDYDLGGQRLVTKKVPQKYEKKKKEICEGWFYLNLLSNTDNKLFQLKDFNKKLNLGLDIQQGNFKITNKTDKTIVSHRNPKQKIRVTFENGEVLNDDKFLYVFRDFLYKIGVHKIAQKNLIFNGEDLITTSNYNGRRKEYEEFRWVKEPGNTKDTYELLNTIKKFVGIKCTIELI